MAEMDAVHDAHDEHPTTTIREYLLIGLLLSVITAVELVMSLYEDALGVILIPGLLIFSAIKFVIVVAMFMHLKFDSIRFTPNICVWVRIGNRSTDRRCCFICV